ncbi:hypothetical protein DFA_03510 [Cavenderia fasciculata]|uniref:Uncharacterized protein n=1 Tax=Cavenderia fasciculata TaxID=261658 RepID=F4PHS8_CACFS|nr:uncharacterized protein DFA_03510 [Cavenderia fasciculata]EGG25262.1 hypothetical protein DFA_03510 [Cavenderia fasciculata]|eukprot:XP_004363113.1 hypothetical protein DFA_03510 [Cavenderia fasciculata]
MDTFSQNNNNNIPNNNNNNNNIVVFEQASKVLTEFDKQNEIKQSKIILECPQDLKDDQPFKTFINFVNNSCRFASDSSNADNLKQVPIIYNDIKKLIIELNNEVKHVDKLSNQVNQIARQLVSTVKNFQIFIRPILPRVEKMKTDILVHQDCIKTDDDLSEVDQQDIGIALSNLTTGSDEISKHILISQNFCGLLIGGIVWMVVKLFKTSNQSSLEKLTRILAGIERLKNINDYFIRSFSQCNVDDSRVRTNLKEISDSMKSLRYRKLNRAVFQQLEKNTNSLIHNLTIISEMKVMDNLLGSSSTPKTNHIKRLKAPSNLTNSIKH